MFQQAQIYKKTRLQEYLSPEEPKAEVLDIYKELDDVIFFNLLASWSDGKVWVRMLEQAGQHGARSAPIGQIIIYFFYVKNANKK
jgi:hypothetical protein